MSKTPFFIFSISGKARHGKDTTAGFLRDAAAKSGYTLLNLPFALPLKARVYGRVTEATLEDVMYRKPEPVRHALQQEGTEKGRDEYGDDFWVRQWEYLIAHIRDTCPNVNGVITPDARFPNEVDAVREVRGATIRIKSNRPTLTGEAALHRSETSLDHYDKGFDYVLTNNLTTSLDDLRSQAEEVFALEEAFLRNELV